MTFNPLAVGDADRYTTVAIGLHWLIAAAIIAQVALGFWMIEIPKDPPGVRAYWFNLHKSIGMTLALLIVARLAWRLAHPPPPLPRHLPDWQRRAAVWNHRLMYGCMIVMPLAGFVGSTFSGFPIKYFGVTLTGWGWKLPLVKDAASAVHLTVAWLFVGLILVHVTAALKHALIDRDGIFQRIWRRPGPRVARRARQVAP